MNQTQICMTENPFTILEQRLNRIESLLLQIKTSQQEVSKTSLTTDKLLTVEQAANFLNLAVPTIYSKVQRKELPVCRRGKRLYFSEKELTEWVKEGRQRTSNEITEEAKSFLRVNRMAS